MNRRTSTKKEIGTLPDQGLVVHLLKEYGDALFEPCPTSEHLVLFSEDPGLLGDRQCHSIERHLTVCMDCQDKIRWLTSPEEDYEDLPEQITSLTFPVCLPSSDSDHIIHDHTACMALVAKSHTGERALPQVPYIENEEGSVYGEIGQDLSHCIFLDLERFPSRYRWHAVQVRAVTRDHEVIESPSITLADPKIMITQRADLRPEDLDRIELRLIHLRPR